MKQLLVGTSNNLILHGCHSEPKAKNPMESTGSFVPLRMTAPENRVFRSALVIKITFIFLIVTSPSIVFAVGGCPQSADRLQDFAGCVVQTRGGAVLRSGSGYGAHLDDDHRELMGAMSANSGVPPQVMPVSGPVIGTPFMPYYPIYPIYPVKNPAVWLYTSYGANPYINMWYSTPLY